MFHRARIRPALIAGSLSLFAFSSALAGSTPTYETPDAEKFVRRMLAEADAGKTLRVSSKTLMQAYKSSEAGANQKYKGKALLVETTVDLVSRDMVGALVVYLKSGSFMPVAARFDTKVTLVEGLESGAGTVKIRQLPAEEAVTFLKRGQTIHMLCKGDGYSLGSPGLELCNMVSL
ncbi:MAG: hypothetical protein NTZ15_14815 [Burkholderiales bacterium]|nr:hypothetical protein [Burkholderiales bacterium]